MTVFADMGTENDVLAKTVRMCALHGTRFEIINSTGDACWSVEPDTKVDDDDMTYPVIVHVRGGTLSSESIALAVVVEAS